MIVILPVLESDFRMTVPLPAYPEPLRYAPFQSPADFERLNHDVDVLTIPGQANALYVAGFACSPRAMERALRLRYEVFNEELGEGLMSSRMTGLDKDEFDDQMHHVVLVEKSTGRVVGTYRLQPVLHGLRHEGIYSARQYDLAPIAHLFPELVETGRACICRDHRSYTAIIMMWQAISIYMTMYRQKYLFGCCSLTTLDPVDGWRAMKSLRSMGVIHPTYNIQPVDTYACGNPAQEFSPEIGPGCKIPRLFSAYLKLGGTVISLPAIDREFGTVDFLVLLDGTSVTFSSVMMR